MFNQNHSHCFIAVPLKIHKTNSVNGGVQEETKIALLSFLIKL